jgi:putative endonuclease
LEQIVGSRLSKQYYVYIITNKPYGTLYIGVTNDLVRRVHEHREGFVAGFSKEYGLRELVWFEVTEDIQAAIQREKQLKEWRRDWKINLIQESNPEWRDLYSDLTA